MIRIGNIRLGKIDWDSNDFTYGQRIELGNIFADEESSHYSKLCRAFKVMYGFSRKVIPMRARIKRYDLILDGLKQWIEKERMLLNYTPTDDELNAGIKDLTEKVGNMSTIKQIAKTYGTDPDEVLKWAYSKVFIILYTDLEERKYETKLQKQIYERTKHRRA